MPNEIAKKLNLILDTKKVTPITIKDFVPIVGDSIEITVNLKEDNLPKNITGIATCRLIGVKSSGEYFEQTENITIVDSLNGVLKIKPRLNIFNVEGKTICGLILEDEDEAINIQRFILTVNNSLERDIVIEGEEEIQTLKRLNSLLNEYQVKLSENESALISIQGKINTMNQKVSQNILETNNKFNDLNLTIDNEFDSLENRLSTLNNTVNTQLSKIIKLSPIDIVGSSFMYFATEIINESAENLLKKSYMVSLAGILDSATYNSCNGILNFYKLNGKVCVNFLTLSDRIVNSRSLSPSVVFDNLTSEIVTTATGFRLLVRSNITKVLNTENTTRCCFTPLSM